LLGKFLCAVIAIDDTMLVHEEVLPSFGVAEELLLAAYALAGFGACPAVLAIVAAPR